MLFQSAPAIAGGRSVDGGNSFGGVKIVSIRARHCWRAIRAGQGDLPASLPAVFQSAPAIAGGRSAGNGGAALRPQMASVFQSAPAIAGGRSPQASGCIAQAALTFQSAPAIAGGRSRAIRRLNPACWPIRRQRPRLNSFNPRPPLLAGDPVNDHESPNWCSKEHSFNPRPPLLAGDPQHSP
jgi:hypothetical protein